MAKLVALAAGAVVDGYTAAVWVADLGFAITVVALVTAAASARRWFNRPGQCWH